MEKVVRFGTIEDQDKFRRDDIRKLHPDKRVEMVLMMQRQYYKWDENPVIKRVASVRSNQK